MIDSTTFKSIDKGVLASAFAVLNEDELQDIFKKSAYLATMEEVKSWEKLSDIETMREFLFDFWKERRNVFKDGKIVSMDAYFKRVDQADKHFQVYPGLMAGRPTGAGFLSYMASLMKLRNIITDWKRNLMKFGFIIIWKGESSFYSAISTALQNIS